MKQHLQYLQKVSVKNTATNQQVKALEDMGDFAIWIEGFAVQSDVSAEYEGFKTWAGTGVVFNNTPTNENLLKFQNLELFRHNDLKNQIYKNKRRLL